ncbi:hypothetical protein AB7179_21300 [Providencia manganoxydans]
MGLDKVIIIDKTDNAVGHSAYVHIHPTSISTSTPTHRHSLRAKSLACE